MNFITPRLLNPQRAPDPAACLWSHLRYAAEPLSITDLVRRTDIDVAIVARQLRAWKKDGLIVSVERTGLFKMAKIAAAQDAPPTIRDAKKLPVRFTPRSMRQRIWTAIRVLKTFDLPMLLIAAEATEKTTVAYLAQLVRAGFLERLDQPGEPHRRYRIVLDTGPHHPSTGRATINGQPHTRLLDHNSGAELHMPIAARRKPVAPFFDQER